MRIIFTAVLFFLIITVFSQQVAEPVVPQDININEFSLNVFNLVSFGAIDVAYERVIDDNSSWALEGFILALERENENVDLFFRKNASLTGKYKYFFGDHTAWGFYINALAMVWPKVLVTSKLYFSRAEANNYWFY